MAGILCCKSISPVQKRLWLVMDRWLHRHFQYVDRGFLDTVSTSTPMPKPTPNPDLYDARQEFLDWLSDQPWWQ
jgi:hypothetical protein